MPIEVITVPCLADNYAYVLGDTVSGNAAVVDIPEAAPINAVLAKRGWQVTDVLITHHHPDHVDGLADLAGADQANIIGAKADARRLPPLTSAVTEGDPLTVLAQLRVGIAHLGLER